MPGLPFLHLRGAAAWAGCALDGLGVDGEGRVRLTGQGMEGCIVTEALDAVKPGIAWHRVFADVALPPGCDLEIEARSAEDREALDTADWISCGALHRRGWRADQPFAPPAPTGPRLETCEGLVRAPPGRWLSLRIRLRGTRRRAPALDGIRVSYPRPSMLAFLPAFWRQADADRQMEAWLALFEGELVALEDRLAALPRLLDPASTPAEALSWLAGLLGLALDARLPEAARRQLIAEAVPLYRRRGTLPGLTRLVSLTLGSDARIVEHFRLRSPDATLEARLGPALQLDGEGTELAHRYTVIVPLEANEDRRALLDAALEFGAPAHALGRALWLDRGTYLGRGSLLDLSFPLEAP